MESLLCLTMIVKNESKGIRRTLESIKPYIDRWAIIDTGSTDDTRAIIEEVLFGMRGALYNEPFVDFSTTRNRVLDWAGTDSVFTLMLSGDEVVENGENLRKFCQERKYQDSQGAYYIDVDFGDTHYLSPRLARAEAGWRYKGLTHEILCKEDMPPPKYSVPDCRIIHHKDPSEDNTQRWEKDLELLTKQIEGNPEDTRTQFYLAQTYHCLKRYKEAIAEYAKRLKLGGWRDEIFMSHYRTGQCYAALNDWNKASNAYLEAYSTQQRAEPLYALALHYYRKNNIALCHLYSKTAVDLVYPDDALFAERAIYDWKVKDLMAISSWKLGDKQTARYYAEAALANNPSDPRLQQNVKSMSKLE